jgi:hypothetical protein
MSNCAAINRADLGGGHGFPINGACMAAQISALFFRFERLNALFAQFLQAHRHFINASLRDRCP